ncbi:MAG: transglutaminase domain-containing protein [Sediminibacterium sp.]|nr:transglutaminase domain-containing protein [Sediminibacterium sp.]MBX9780713.1 transglutaminase domain-containing protein [Chitinophagaceae bacterium]
MRKILRFFRKIFLNTSILLFLNGLLLGFSIYFKLESNYEDELFTSLVENVIETANPSKNLDSFFISSMRLTHTLEVNRQNIFRDNKPKGLKANFFRPAVVDLMTGDGDCGSYAVVLARLLKSAGYKVRIAQMQVHGVNAGHMVVEAKKRSGWIVLDPTVNQYFKKPDGSLASFKDVQQNWDYYKKQTHSNYVQSYKYEGVRYTNWSKIPYLGNGVKSIIKIFIGEEETNEIAIRSYLLRKYHFFYSITATLYAISSILLIITVFRKKR